MLGLERGCEFGGQISKRGHFLAIEAHEAQPLQVGVPEIRAMCQTLRADDHLLIRLRSCAVRRERDEVVERLSRSARESQIRRGDTGVEPRTSSLVFGIVASPSSM